MVTRSLVASCGVGGSWMAVCELRGSGKIFNRSSLSAVYHSANLSSWQRVRRKREVMEGIWVGRPG